MSSNSRERAIHISQLEANPQACNAMAPALQNNVNYIFVSTTSLHKRQASVAQHRQEAPTVKVLQADPRFVRIVL